MFNYENLKNIIQKNTNEKIKSVIYTSWYGNTIKFIIFIILIVEILLFTIARLNLTLYLIIYVSILIFSIGYITTRKAGLALTENNLVCVIFYHLKNSPKEIYEISKNELKNLSIHKILYLYFISISFIDKTGRLKTKKLYFSTFMPGSHSKEFKENSLQICEKLLKIEHIMEKGDF